MSRIHWQFVRIKVLLAVLACGVALLAVTNALFFCTALNAQRQQLHRTLMASALMTDVGNYERIPPRPYHPNPLAIEQAAQELRTHAGMQFHPDAVRALIDILHEEGKLQTPFTGAKG